MKRTILFSALLVLLTVPVNSQWITDPTVNNLISTLGLGNDLTYMVEGDGGSFFVASIDYSDNTLYMQKVSALGIPQWPVPGAPSGIEIDSMGTDADYYEMISDGSGGVIIAWHANEGVSGYKAYVQRFNSNGVALWPASGDVNGVELSASDDDQEYPTLLSDGNGGVYAAWEQADSTSINIFAQRVNSLGAVQWGSEGVEIIATDDNEDYPYMVEDGSGGAILFWILNLPADNKDIYAQKLDSLGALQWGAGGIAVTAAADEQDDYWAIADGSGGAILVWEDNRNDPGLDDVYSQKINNDGSLAWGVNALPLTSGNNEVEYVDLVTDGSGGAIFVWQDYRLDSTDSGSSYIFSQRVDAGGTPLWTPDGIRVSNDTIPQDYPLIVSDDNGGAVIAWINQPDGCGCFGDNELYAQRVNADSSLEWGSSGLPVSTYVSFKVTPYMISNGSNGAYISWVDVRDGFQGDIYASNLSGDGSLPVELNSFTASVSNGKILLKWNTVTEVNNYGFEIQRLKDYKTERLKDSDEAWEKAGFVKGNGNSNETNSYSFVDEGIAGKVLYRLKQIDNDGKFTYSPAVEVSFMKPDNFALSQNYPNPFNPSTRIEYTIPEESFVTLKVYDILGSEAASLVNEKQEAGYYIVNFDAANLSAGTYIYRLSAGSYTKTMKMVVLK